MTNKRPESGIVKTSEEKRNERLEHKVEELEKSVKTLRGEMDIKMKILEEILNNRNEQFTIQMKLLQREQSLYRTVLQHWRNSENLAASGFSLQFAEEGRDSDDNDIECKIVDETEISMKRKAAFERRARKKRLRLLKRLKSDDDGVRILADDEYPEIVSEVVDEGEASNDEVTVVESDENFGAEGSKKKVFVNYYSEQGSKQGERSSNPIWSYFLRGEKGLSAFCCLCDEEGVEKVLAMSNGTTSPLWRHLTRTHDITFGPDHPLRPKSPSDPSLYPYERQATPKVSTEVITEITKRSDVWEHFLSVRDQNLGKNFAKCKYCPDTKYSIGGKTNGSTSNLRGHLTKHHSNIFSNNDS